MKNDNASAALNFSVNSGKVVISLSGRLDAENTALLWPKMQRALNTKGVESIAVQGQDITYCDGAGTGLLVYIRKVSFRLEVPVDFSGLPDDVAAMFALYPCDKIVKIPTADTRGTRDLVEQIGQRFYEELIGLKEYIEFLGELIAGLLKTLFRPSALRIKDFLVIIEASGPQALPIVGMLGFLIGLIIAFQGATLMKQFGAEIYVADSAGLLMTRELGPLITAIIVAGRTGSAFAAEIGTMKVNEEIDAFSTMGLDPVRFLVIPRVIAASVMTPLLTVFANLFGIAGGAIVMMSMGYPLVTYVNRLLAALEPFDYLGGLMKALVFGFLISASGCMCGLRTGEGASAVGNSATRAVVSSIMLIVIADGIFAVLFYFLGI